MSIYVLHCTFPDGTATTVLTSWDGDKDTSYPSYVKNVWIVPELFPWLLEPFELPVVNSLTKKYHYAAYEQLWTGYKSYSSLYALINPVYPTPSKCYQHKSAHFTLIPPLFPWLYAALDD